MDRIFRWSDFTGEGKGSGPGVPLVRGALLELFDAVPIGLLVVSNTTHRVIAANREMSRIVGYSHEELMAMEWHVLVAPEDLERVKDYRARRLRGDPTIPRQYEMLLRNRNGDRKVVEFRAGVVPFDDVLMVSIRDITAEKLLLDPMLYAQKVDSLASLAGGVAGEFNNLLAAISGYAQLAGTRVERPAEVKDALSRILAAVDQGAEHTRALLTFARRGANALESVDVCALLSDIASVLPGLTARRFALTIEKPENRRLVRGDASQIEQAFLALLQNAAEATADTGGRISVAVSAGLCEFSADEELPSGEYVTVSITDNGAGIPVENLQRIFQPFFSTKEPARHPGLGLPTAYGAIRAHGGTIRVESRLGTGTTVTVFLPAQTDPSLLVPAVPTEVPEKRRKSCILVVDDQEFVAELFKDLLTSAGYEVLCETDGRSALEAVRSGQFCPDVAIVDIMMPEIDGRELIRALYAHAPATAILAMSGFARPAEQDARISAIVKGYVTKPFNNDAVLALVAKVLKAQEVGG